MGLFYRITSLFNDWHTFTAGSAVGDIPTINPATGLLMNGAVDVVGNPFGIDLPSRHHDSWYHDPHSAGSAFDDHHTTWHDPITTGMGGGHDPWHN